MKIRKILIILVSVTLLAAMAFAYSTDWNSLSSGAGDTESDNFKTRTDVIGSGVVQGNASGLNNTIIGFLAALFQTVDVHPPEISNFKIDGKAVGSEVRDGDYIDEDAELTATVTDDVAVDESASEVGADSDLLAFDQLTGSSSYDVASGALTYVFNNLPDGDHTVKITAFDTSGKSTEESITVKVTSVLKAVNLLVYPNPYNPDAGNLRIEYQLTQQLEGPIDIFVFNQINQLVYRRTIQPGSDGGRIGHNTIYWNGVDNFNAKLSPGIYFLKIASGKKLLGKHKIAVLR
jgi:hypothetical protein